jgi:hypothetical protein
VKGFQGWGVISMNLTHVGVVLHVERARIGSQGEFEEVVDVVYPFAPAGGRRPVPLLTRVAVEGVVHDDGVLEATFIKADPSTSSMQHASMVPSRSQKESTVQTVTMTAEEFEQQKQKEFKDGIRYAMKLAIERLQKVAKLRFMEKKDDVAREFREAAQTFEDDKKSLPHRDYTVRPYLGE